MHKEQSRACALTRVVQSDVGSLKFTGTFYARSLGASAARNGTKLLAARTRAPTTCEADELISPSTNTCPAGQSASVVRARCVDGRFHRHSRWASAAQAASAALTKHTDRH